MPNLLPSSSTDPFTLVFCALWDALENAQGVVGFVAPGNRIKWLGFTKEPRKDEHATQSDKPELRIDPGEPFAEPELTTGTNILRVKWRVLIATDAQQLDRLGNNMQGASILAVQWEIFRALIGWQQPIKALTWQGSPFVHKVKMGVPFLALENKELNRGTVGWSAGWNYETWLNFNVIQNLPVPVT